MFIHLILSYLSTCDIVLVDINECISSPCVNGANCTEAVGGYTCACVARVTLESNARQVSVWNCHTAAAAIVYNIKLRKSRN